MNQKTEQAVEPILGIDFRSYCHLFLGPALHGFTVCGIPEKETVDHPFEIWMGETKCRFHPNGMCPKCVKLSHAWEQRKRQ